MTTHSLILVMLIAGAMMPAASTAGELYCQEPEETLYMMSSGFEAEIADDIPTDLATRTIDRVTLWAGEWYSMGGPGWREPLGVEINFYLDSCPPELDPASSFTIAWDDLEKELVVDTSSKTIYRVTATLPDGGVTITHTMSIGATVNIDWGHDEPFTGLSPTAIDDIHGACEAWLDSPWYGYTRWTTIAWPADLPRDLGYCLYEAAPQPPVPFIVTGPGPGPANPTEVRTWDLFDLSEPQHQWTAYGVDQFGVNVAAGDLDGDGICEFLTGPGPGAVFGPHVRGFDFYGAALPGLSFLAYGTPRWGVNVGCGDIDGDGMDEILTGAGPGAVFGPHVRAFDYDGSGVTPIPWVSYFAYGTPKWGVNAATGDLDGDGRDEIITGAGPGTVYGPHVRGWSTIGSAVAPLGGVSFLAYGTHQWGVNVGCGDIDGDGMDEIITGPGPGVAFGPHVRAWDVDGGPASPISSVSFFAYQGLLYGARVAALDVDEDGIAEILTVPGPDPSAVVQVRAWDADGGSVSLVPGTDFTAYDVVVTHGGSIAGAVVDLQ